MVCALRDSGSGSGAEGCKVIWVVVKIRVPFGGLY